MDPSAAASMLAANPAYANLSAPPFDPANPQSFRLPPAPYPGQEMGGANPFMRKKKPRCYEFDAKGYCSRGLTCKFDHSIDFSAMQPPQLPSGPEGDDGMIWLLLPGRIK